MARARIETTQPVRRVALHLSASIPASFESVVLPWFQSASAKSWQQPQPTIVAVPFRTHAYALKKSLLERGLSLVGIRFVAPAQLRELVGARTRMRLALREHLRLLLSIAAEAGMNLPEDPALRAESTLAPDFLAAKSVKRAPDHLLRTLDQLGAAGWDFSALNLPPLREIVSRFEQRLQACGFELIHAADRRALAEAKNGSPLFANILLTGFNGAHWPLWPLLHAAVLSASEGTVLLDDPRDESRDLDEAWVGTWEEEFGEARPVSSSPLPSGDALFSEAEMRGEPARDTVDRSFLVGADTVEQAEAVAQQCLQFLAESACTRIGIVFSGPGALPRLASDALDRLKISHYDNLAHLRPGPFEASDWDAWIELQHNPRINSLLQFVNALEDREKLFPALQPDFERTLRSAYSELLVDDLEILQRFCAQDSSESRRAASIVLQSILFLPAQARFSQFLRDTKIAFDRLQWQARWVELSRHLGDWPEQLRDEFSRGLFLRWLDEIGSTFTTARAPAGNHPYARVQLLSVPQAQNQEWSHLIFAGWNEGAWPSPEKGEFTRQSEIDAFNRGIQKINRRTIRPGRHGEGHTVVRAGHTLYLGPTEQNRIELRQFEALVESVRKKVTFTASRVKEDAPERLWNPSELFTRHYQEAQHSPLTQEAMDQLHAKTRKWLEELRPPPSNNGEKKLREQTRVAYDARRDPGTRANEYDFAFRSAPPAVPIFSVSDFEQLISAPALIWLKKYLGVKAVEENINVWNTSSGKWVHDWLASIVGAPEKNFAPLPDGAELAKRICASAEAKHAQLATLCRAAGKPLPDWWLGGWRNALFLARALGEKLATLAEWPWIATEWKVAGEFPMAEGSSTTLRLSGRIDLLMAREQPAAESLKTADLWIIDYKTGAKKPLAAGSLNAEGRRSALKKRLLDGSAVQLGLYAMAARALGAEAIYVSFLSPVVRPLQPQVADSDFSSETEIFSALAEMQQTGVFGMHGTLRSAYRFTDDYPLATLAIDSDILEQRWEMTHPALVRDDEEVFW